MNGLDIVLINVISYLGGILSGIYIHHKMNKNKKNYIYLIMGIFKLLTYLIGITNVLSQSVCDNCIDSQNRGENIDCTNICQGQETHLTDCLQYTRCLYDYDLHKVHNICVCQKVECEYEYLCPHSEILHYGAKRLQTNRAVSSIKDLAWKGSLLLRARALGMTGLPAH